jgi:hypothetical protein
MIKLFSVTLSILMLVFLSYVGGQHVGHAAGKTHGQLMGCQELLDVISGGVAECVFVEGKLAIEFIDGRTGKPTTEILSEIPQYQE